MSQAALPTIRTPRLTLRPPEMTDADAIVDGIGNYDVSKWLSSVPYPYGHDDAVAWLNKTVGTARQCWLICTDDGVIGTVSNEPQFGFWLARPFWRQGYAFEAGQAATRHWFCDPGAGNLVAGYFPGNARSSAALYALGFEDTAVNPHEARALRQTMDAQEVRLTRSVWETLQRFEIETDRLKIRPLDATDAQAMLALAAPEVARNTGSFDPDWTLETLTEYIRARRWCGRAAGMFAVEENGAFIGIVGCGGMPVSAMYAFKPEVWGRGIATEAARAVLAEVFARFPVNRIIASHYDDNPASGAVLRKLGFEDVGRGMSQSKARLEPQATIEYAVTRNTFKAST